ncbi:ABC transporter permease [Micromonospora mangrovi]|uniref:ABC transporter permease n=2 Tax=Micromonospora TaxID=1873 RepID=A0AAU8HE49_9ACTN
MTAPTLNGTKYPQPIEELLPAARKLTEELGEVPSRNRLMQTFRIGAPKASELRNLLTEEAVHRDLDEAFDRTGTDEEPPADPWLYAEPIGPDPAPLLHPPSVPLDPSEYTARTVPAPVVPEPDRAADRAETLRTVMALRGSFLTPRTDPADTRPENVTEPDPTPAPAVPAAEPVEQVTTVGHPDTPTPPTPSRRAVAWPVMLLALPAFVAIWSGWVGLGGLTGFGIVHPLPGIVDGFSINSAITLPIGVETYGAYALYVWLSGRVPAPALRFAKWSALGSLIVGALGQVAYHLLVAAGIDSAPWWITTAVACLPVAVLGMGAALAHLVRTHD